MKTPRLPPPEICPVCGEDVPSRALACPECGADYNSGWRDEAEHDLPAADEEFDYDEFVAREFGHSPRPAGIHPLWWITALVVLLALALAWFRG